MKQFELEEYLRLKAEGKEPRICTRDGKSVRIICTDRKTLLSQKPFYTIVALLESGKGERIASYTARGTYYKNEESGNDLFFAELEEEKPTYDFKPFDKVLVRDHGEAEWDPDFFIKCTEDDYGQLEYVTLGSGGWRYCIHYEGNEELLGTTNAPKK